MKKNGFTLVELVASITILIVVTIIVTVSISTMSNKNDQKRYDDFKKSVENAACSYIELAINRDIKEACYNNCTVSVSTLISNGFINEDLLNPQTGENVKGTSTVSITWDTTTGEKTCTLNGE